MNKTNTDIIQVVMSRSFLGIRMESLYESIIKHKLNLEKGRNTEFEVGLYHNSVVKNYRDWITFQNYHLNKNLHTSSSGRCLKKSLL